MARRPKLTEEQLAKRRSSYKKRIREQKMAQRERLAVLKQERVERERTEKRKGGTTRQKWGRANRARLRENSLRWAKANPDAVKDMGLRAKYGITLAERDALLAAQAFRCAICGSDDPGAKKGWNVDHCHVSGKVRGILCQHCNHMLGNARDNTATLAAAINYLSRPPLVADKLRSELETR